MYLGLADCVQSTVVVVVAVNFLLLQLATKLAAGANLATRDQHLLQTRERRGDAVAMLHRLILLVALLIAPASGLRVPTWCSRRDALVAASSACLLPTPALAVGDAKYDESKYKKKFQDCLSKCIYEKTKIAKGIAQVEVIPRDQAFAECKVQCKKEVKKK